MRRRRTHADPTADKATRSLERWLRSKRAREARREWKSPEVIARPRGMNRTPDKENES